MDLSFNTCAASSQQMVVHIIQNCPHQEGYQPRKRPYGATSFSLPRCRWSVDHVNGRPYSVPKWEAPKKPPSIWWFPWFIVPKWEPP